MDEYDWLISTSIQTTKAFGRRVLPYAKPRTNAIRLMEEDKLRQARNTRLKAQVEELQAGLEDRAVPIKLRLLEEHRPQLAAELYEKLKQTLQTPAQQRDEEQQELARNFERYLGLAPQDVQERDPAYGRLVQETARRVAWLQYEQQPEPQIRALWDRGEPSPPTSCDEVSTPNRDAWWVRAYFRFLPTAAPPSR